MKISLLIFNAANGVYKNKIRMDKQYTAQLSMQVTDKNITFETKSEN